MNNLDELIVKYINTNDDFYMEEILIETRPMIFHIINRYYSNNCHFDKIDYYQMLAMKYPEWIEKFTQKETHKFSTFLYTCAKNAFLKILRKENTKKRKNNIISYLEDKTSGSGTFVDVLSDDTSVEETYVTNINIRNLYEYLYEKFGDDAKYYIGYLEGYKPSTLSEIYNVDVSVVKNAIKRIKKRLQSLLPKS